MPSANSTLTLKLIPLRAEPPKAMPSFAVESPPHVITGGRFAADRCSAGSQRQSRSSAARVPPCVYALRAFWNRDCHGDRIAFSRCQLQYDATPRLGVGTDFQAPLVVHVICAGGRGHQPQQRPRMSLCLTSLLPALEGKTATARLISGEICKTPTKIFSVGCLNHRRSALAEGVWGGWIVQSFWRSAFRSKQYLPVPCSQSWCIHALRDSSAVSVVNTAHRR